MYKFLGILCTCVLPDWRWRQNFRHAWLPSRKHLNPYVYKGWWFTRAQLRSWFGRDYGMNYFITPITLCGIHPCFRFIIHFRWKYTCAFACMCVCKCEYIWISIKIELLNWGLFLRFEMIMIHYFSWGHGLGLNRRQSVTWHNDNPV